MPRWSTTAARVARLVRRTTPAPPCPLSGMRHSAYSTRAILDGRCRSMSCGGRRGFTSCKLLTTPIGHRKFPEHMHPRSKTWLQRPKAAAGELLSVDGHGGATRLVPLPKFGVGCDVVVGTPVAYSMLWQRLISIVTCLGRGTIPLAQPAERDHEREPRWATYSRRS